MIEYSKRLIYSLCISVIKSVLNHRWIIEVYFIHRFIGSVQINMFSAYCTCSLALIFGLSNLFKMGSKYRKHHIFCIVWIQSYLWFPGKGEESISSWSYCFEIFVYWQRSCYTGCHVYTSIMKIGVTWNRACWSGRNLFNKELSYQRSRCYPEIHYVIKNKAPCIFWGK